MWIRRTVFLAEGIWKVHIFRHLFVCYQTSVYTSWEFHQNRNNNTVFDEFSVSIEDLTVANIRFTSPVKRHLRPSNPQLTPLTLQIQFCYSLNEFYSEFEPRARRGVLDTTLCDNVCEWLTADRWFSPVSPTNKTERHDIAVLLLIVALSTKD